MKSFVALLAVVAVVAADVSHIVRNPDQDAQILKQGADVLPDQFNYFFETSNGIAANQEGILQNVGSENEAIAVRGSNSYTAPDGQVIQISYVADADGYRAEGAHLPTSPPAQEIPEYIVRSLEYIRTHPPKPEPGQRA